MQATKGSCWWRNAQKWEWRLVTSAPRSNPQSLFGPGGGHTHPPACFATSYPGLEGALSAMCEFVKCAFDSWNTTSTLMYNEQYWIQLRSRLKLYFKRIHPFDFIVQVRIDTRRKWAMKSKSEIEQQQLFWTQYLHAIQWHWQCALRAYGLGWGWGGLRAVDLIDLCTSNY